MLTPLDIDNKKFSRSMRGYSVEEVDDFLEELTNDYERLYRENAEYKEQIEQGVKDLEHYRNVEHTLQNTLVMAQSTAEEVKNVAKKQADQLLNEAKATAERDVIDLEQKVSFKIRQLETSQKQFDIYKAKMESLLISQLELIKEVNKDN